jgi:ABC-type Mn2+/Zn2+ transport system ATPase subunit
VPHLSSSRCLPPLLLQGDASLAGERGINLSGGQRQRLALARAAYHDADLVLLDNPLSAVDQHTSKHIFDYAIKGLLKDKAVVLIAHQLELLPRVRGTPLPIRCLLQLEQCCEVAVPTVCFIRASEARHSEHIYFTCAAWPTATLAPL